MSIIYLDNAATTQLSPSVLEEMMLYLTNQYGNPSSNYSLGIKARKAKEAARERVASLIGASPEEIFFTSGATESNNWIVRAMNECVYGSMLTSDIEHLSILTPIKRLDPDWFNTISCNARGIVQADGLRKSLKRHGDVKLVSIMMVNNEVGSINNIPSLAKIAHEFKAIFHTDATQALGHMKIDVKSLGVDALSGSSHKIYGPKGVGFLYINRKSPLWDIIHCHPFLMGGHQEVGVRAGTENIAGIVGFGKACELIKAEIPKDTVLRKWKKTMYDRLHFELGVISNIPIEDKTIPILNIRIPGVNNQELLQLLDETGVCVSTGSACNETGRKQSHVLAALGLNEKEISESIRISFGKNNTAEELSVAEKMIIDKANILQNFK